MRFSLPFILIICVISAILCGCQKRPFFQYTDEPYLQFEEKLGFAQIKLRLRSIYKDDRIIALRALADKIRQGNKLSEVKDDDERLTLLLNHFSKERDRAVKSILVGICLRDAGVYNQKVKRFLFACIDAGDVRQDACFTLAALSPEDAVTALVPLLRHPRYELRYQAGLALSTLADKSGLDSLTELVKTMQKPVWPSKIMGMPLAQCQANLISRVSRWQAKR